MNNQGGIGCGTWIAIILFILLIIGSMSTGGKSNSSSSYRSSGGYTNQQFRDDFNYFKGRYDAMTGQ